MLDLSLGTDIYKSTVFDEAAQEIDILFNTENTELIGYPKFGTCFDEYLWTLTPTTTALTDYIEQKLNETSFVNKLQHHVKIDYEFDKDRYENIYKVNIILYDDYSSIQKTYTLNEKV